MSSSRMVRGGGGGALYFWVMGKKEQMAGSQEARQGFGLRLEGSLRRLQVVEGSRCVVGGIGCGVRCDASRC